MKTKYLLIGLALFSGCNLEIPDVKQYNIGSNTVVTDSIKVISGPTPLVFVVQISALDRYGANDDGYFEQGNFTFTSPGTYNIVSFEDVQLPGTIPPSLVFLEDQSGSYAEDDPENFRSKEINFFLHQIQAPGNFRMAGYSKGGSVQSPVEFSKAGFSTDPTTQLDFLFQLPSRTGGISSLYDALSVTIEQISGIQSDNKHIVVLAHAPDAGSNTTLSDLVNAAAANRVRIHILYLGDLAQGEPLAALSSQTGGNFAILPTNLELITALNQLYRLLCGVRHVYSMNVNYTPTSGSISSGSDIFHTMNVYDPIIEINLNPVVVYTKVP
jgi:hypothetical protein